MEDISYTFKKIFKRYKIEFFLILAACIATLISFSLYLQENKEDKLPPSTVAQEPEIKESSGEIIYIDIAGSIDKPDMYAATPGSRLKHVLDKAGGLSDDADFLYFSRNFNLSRLLQDQEKIYIPSRDEVMNGLFKEEFLIQNSNLSINTIETSVNDQIITTKININSATLEELDTLPSIGQVTAQKIIDNRPYTTIEDLVLNKVVSQTIFEKIKELIE